MVTMDLMQCEGKNYRVVMDKASFFKFAQQIEKKISNEVNGVLVLSLRDAQKDRV